MVCFVSYFLLFGCLPLLVNAEVLADLKRLHKSRISVEAQNTCMAIGGRLVNDNERNISCIITTVITSPASMYVWEGNVTVGVSAWIESKGCHEIKENNTIENNHEDCYNFCVSFKERFKSMAYKAPRCICNPKKTINKGLDCYPDQIQDRYYLYQVLNECQYNTSGNCLKVQCTRNKSEVVESNFTESQTCGDFNILSELSTCNVMNCPNNWQNKTHTNVTCNKNESVYDLKCSSWMLNVTAKTSDVPPARTVAFTNNVITSTNIAVQENSVFTTTDSKYGKEHDTWGNDSNSVGLICGLIITGLVFAVASVAVVCKLRHIGPCKKTLVYKQKIEVKVINQESQLYQDERINVIKMTNTVANNVYGIANETRESVTTELTPSQTIQNNIYAIVMKSTEQANPENFLAEEYDQLNKPLTRVKTHNESQLYDVCLGSRDDADPVYNSSSNNKLTNRNIDMTYDLASTVVNKKQ